MMVVVAHPDDETFGCGSLIAHAAARGVETTVLCATRGEAGTPAPGSGVAPRDLAAVREQELRRAGEVLGVDRIEVLGWRDSGMDGEPPGDSLVAAPVPEVRDVILDRIERWRPHVVVTMDASDGHRDHARIRDATLAAAEGARWPVERVYLHCLPQRLMRQWVRELAAQQPDAGHLALGELGTPDEEITTEIDTSHLLELRERAIAAHSSQVSPYEVMSPTLRRDFLRLDRLRRMRPPWNGGPRERDLFG